MRALLATTVAAAVTCAGAFVLPTARPAAAHPAVRYGSAEDAPGVTRTLPLTPLAPGDAPRAKGAATPLGIGRRTVAPFSLLGVTWDDGRAALGGTAQARTRSSATGRWSGWQDLETGDDLPDLDSPERAAGRTRGGTAPLWVGDADGVEVRVTPGASGGRAVGDGRLAGGLRVDLVDPGGAAAPRTAGYRWPGGPDGWDDGYDDGPDRSDPPDDPDPADSPDPVDRPDPPDTGTPGAAARPRIVARSGWGADESLREAGFSYTGPVRAVFVHHTATGNGYTCAQVPALIRGIYRYHVRSEGWRDIGYNFLIDKCGTIYEGRAGGVTRPVLGAHTLGFNTDTSGVAVIGSFAKAEPSAAAIGALEHLAAWKLSLGGADAGGDTTLVSRGSGKYAAGTSVRFHTVAAHRDAFSTECPGARLYARLPAVRRAAATLQGR